MIDYFTVNTVFFGLQADNSGPMFSFKEAVFLSMVASFSKGLMVSNSGISELLGISRRNVVATIQALYDKGVIKNTGTDQRRKLVLTGAISALAKTPTGAISAPVLVQSLHPTGAISAQTGANSAPISKEIKKTTTNRDDAVLLKIPDKIKDQFSSRESLRQFYFSCNGKVELMIAYLDFSSRQGSIKNPVGFAVSMAKERGLDGPPDSQSEENMQKKPKQCGYCDQPAVKYTVHDRKEVGLCEAHLLLNRELKGKHGSVNAEMFNQAVSPAKAAL
ncbi:MAG: hypothetical protein DRP56_08320 [Planctomycetota bacterium]|nr:MAG: hypothetical protein DRP56_08320 [Planctomycetota bacterium]